MDVLLLKIYPKVYNTDMPGRTGRNLVHFMDVCKYVLQVPHFKGSANRVNHHFYLISFLPKTVSAIVSIGYNRDYFENTIPRTTGRL